MCSFGRPLSLLVFVFNLKKTVRFVLRLMLKKNLALIEGEFFLLAGNALFDRGLAAQKQHKTKFQIR